MIKNILIYWQFFFNLTCNMIWDWGKIIIYLQGKNEAIYPGIPLTSTPSIMARSLLKKIREMTPNKFKMKTKNVNLLCFPPAGHMHNLSVEIRTRIHVF